MSDKNRRIVVTGIGALTPIGLNVDEFWNGMMASKSGAAMIKQFDTSKVETKFACELKDFDVLNFLDKKTARRLDPFAQYALVSARQAVEDANLKPDTLSEDEKNRIGVYPNPAKNEITIENTEPTPNEVISIYNMEGQLLMQQQLTNAKIKVDIRGLKKGIYLLKLSGRFRTEVMKFIISAGVTNIE